MTKVIMHGCNGKMGQTITAMCKDDPEIEIVAGIDLYDGIKNDYPVFPNISVCDVKADAVIDFSNAKAVDDLLIYCEEKQVPVVLCTTGLSEEQLAKVKQVSGHVAVLKSANMSLGINMLMELLKKAALTLAPAGFDMEIVEKHHNQKLDAPSGTALALADSMNEALNEKYAYVYDRSRERKKREKYEIGISAVRGGNIVGEHEVIFAGTDEVKYQATRVQAYYNEGKWGPTESFMELVGDDPRKTVILKNGVGDVFGPQQTIRKASNAEGTMPTYLMRYSEIYMMKAECEARTGKGDPLATLNALRSGHGLPAITGVTDILQTIYQEWILEMGFENGHEWYATWRMGVDQLLETNRAVAEKMATAADPELYKANLPYKRIYPIPSSEINANKLMEQNPGNN